MPIEHMQSINVKFCNYIKSRSNVKVIIFCTFEKLPTSYTDMKYQKLLPTLKFVAYMLVGSTVAQW